MDAALLFARLILVAVFLVAAVAKLADREGSRQAMLDFGVPAPLAGAFGTLLPIAELAVAVALIFPSSAWAGALGAGVLLLMFVEGIGVSIARGERPRCHCFGQLGASRAGWGALFRALAFAALAGFVVIAGAQDAGPGPADLDPLVAVGLVAGLLLAVQTWLVIRLARRNAELERSVAALDRARTPGGPGLPVGSAAPEFSLPGLYGERLTLSSLRAAGNPVLLLFTDPGCGPCSALLPRVSAWQREHAGELTVALVSRGGVDDNRARTDEHDVSIVLLQSDQEVADTFGASASPAAVLIHADGTVASGLASGHDAVIELAALAVTKPQATLLELFGAEGPAVGRPAPEIELEDLDGRPFTLLDLEGERVLVLFWDPACEFCGRMLGDIAAWAADPPAGSPALVVVSRGSVAANRALDIASTVLIDPDGLTSRAFGATGTPMGVLLDDEGRIASQIATGAPAIFELLSVETAS